MPHQTPADFRRLNLQLAASVTGTNQAIEQMVDKAFVKGADAHEFEFGKTCRLMCELDLFLGPQPPLDQLPE